MYKQLACHLTATAARLLLVWSEGGCRADVLQTATAYLLALGDFAAACGLQLPETTVSGVAAATADRYHCLLLIQSSAAIAAMTEGDEDRAEVAEAVAIQCAALEMLVSSYGATAFRGLTVLPLTSSRMSLNLKEGQSGQASSRVRGGAGTALRVPLRWHAAPLRQAS